MKQDDIDNRFTYQPARGAEGAVYSRVRAEAKRFAEFLNGVVPDGRELSLAITHLEETVMWANAGIARGPFIHAELRPCGNPATIVKDGVPLSE